MSKETTRKRSFWLENGWLRWSPKNAAHFLGAPTFNGSGGGFGHILGFGPGYVDLKDFDLQAYRLNCKGPPSEWSLTTIEAPDDR